MLGPVVCDIVGTTLSEIEKRRIAHPLVGMVILFARNYENRTQLEKLCRAIHDIKPGVLIGVDHEGGRVQRFRDGFTEIPAMSAYGRAYRDDPEATARALTAVGFPNCARLVSTLRLLLCLTWIGGRAKSLVNALLRSILVL